jgi:formate dehydrogenase iron-sulfur subunit
VKSVKISRRSFLKLSGAALAGSAVAGAVTPARAAEQGIPGIDQKVMLNDVSKCIGCLSCAIACKEVNKLPDTYKYDPATGGNAFTTVKFMERGDTPKQINLKVQCMHCTEASCVEVCPTGAAYKRTDGIVLFDQETCIGCKYCVVSCPFNVPGLAEETGTVRKCTFCEPRLREGKITACAEACPAQAIEYGDYDRLLQKVNARVDYLKANGYPDAVLYGEKELAGLKVIYVLPAAPGESGLAANPRLATGDSLAKWAAGLITVGLLAVSPLRSVFKDEKGPGMSSNIGSGVKKDG